MPAGVSPGDIYSHTSSKGNNYKVAFDQHGFPEFGPHVVDLPNGKKGEVKIDMDGTYEGQDFARADKAAGITQEYRRENGLTWHHHQDAETMQLVPADLNEVPHSGGAAVIRSARDVASQAGVQVSSLFLPGTTAAIMADADSQTESQMMASDMMSYVPGVNFAWDGLGLGEKGQQYDNLAEKLKTGKLKKGSGMFSKEAEKFNLISELTNGSSDDEEEIEEE